VLHILKGVHTHVCCVHRSPGQHLGLVNIDPVTMVSAGDTSSMKGSAVVW